MMKHKLYTVSEYDYLYQKSQNIEHQNAHFHPVDAVTFSSIKKFILEHTNTSSDVSQYLTIEYKKYYGEVIHFQNYVGVIQTKQGVSIEILPKIYRASKQHQANHPKYQQSNQQNAQQESKKVFLKMLRRLRHSPFKGKKIPEAYLQKKQFPILEIFISLFLQELTILVKQGLKKSYQPQHENLYYLK